MSLIKFSTERRVTIAMVTISLVLFGLIGLSKLKVNLLPDLSYPTLTVRTEYTGAAPAEIETLISKPIEEVIGTVKNVARVRSTSRTGQSDVVLEFAWGADMDAAGLDVREKLELLQLPLQAKKPLLLRFNPSTEPVLRLGLTSTSDDPIVLQGLRTYAEDELKKRLEPIAGVATAKIAGGLEEQIEVALDAKKMSILGVDASVVISKLGAENVNLAGGRLDEANQRFLVRTIAQFESPEAMGELVVATRPSLDGQNVPVRLNEIASVLKGSKEREAIIRIDGREAVEIAIYKEGDANTVSVAAAVKDVLQKIDRNYDVVASAAPVILDAKADANKPEESRSQLPEGAKLTKIEDQSRFIKSSIKEVVEAAVFGGILSVLIIFLFLGDGWSTVVISLSLPVSIIASFFFMQQFGITLNVMSLGGIALATGMVVDNAIVVLENIKRLRDKGLGVVAATVQGTSEVSMAITASTLTHIAVFLPLVFVQGIAGQLFRDQALTVTFAMIISLFVAITLIPMLASLEGEHVARFTDDQTALSQAHQRGRVSAYFAAMVREIIAVPKWIGRGIAWVLSFPAAIVMRSFSALERFYTGLLRHSLKNPAPVLLIGVASFASALYLVPKLGLELIPEFAQGRLQVDIKLPPGTPLAQTDARMQALQVAGKGAPMIDSLYATSGSGTRLDASPTDSGENVARLMIQMTPGTKRSAEPEITAQFRALTAQIPGADAKFSRPQLFSFATPLEVEIIGDDLDALKASSDEFAKKMRADPLFVDVKSSLEQGAPEVRLYFDQDKVSALGLSTREVADQVVRQVRGEVATRYSLRDRKIDVLVRARELDRDSLDAIKRMIINPTSAKPSTLESVAKVEITEGPAEIRRNDQERLAVISATVASGDLGAGAQRARQILATMRMPANMVGKVAGQSSDMQASFNSLLVALALAIFLVYLVMASQFESLLHPFLILFSVPLALVGAVYALYLTHTTLSVIVFIGLIMLVGIVVSNAIVLIDRVNQLRAGGMAKYDALIQGGLTRLRPIVMTTLTTLVGFLPMALGTGEGAELRAPLAITVIGGLVFSTLLTLIVVPVLYQLIDRRTSLPAHMLKHVTAAE
jgi:hydrophobic/amphiphilic exporter-1 (mainly G- bacteria), HAE1 family